ncbi:MAG: hypothetical protein ACPGYF_03110 [Chitinophagales bacterium]
MVRFITLQIGLITVCMLGLFGCMADDDDGLVIPPSQHGLSIDVDSLAALGHLHWIFDSCFCADDSLLLFWTDTSPIQGFYYWSSSQQLQPWVSKEDTLNMFEVFVPTLPASCAHQDWVEVTIRRVEESFQYILTNAFNWAQPCTGEL